MNESNGLLCGVGVKVCVCKCCVVCVVGCIIAMRVDGECALGHEYLAMVTVCLQFTPLFNSSCGEGFATILLLW